MTKNILTILLLVLSISAIAQEVDPPEDDLKERTRISLRYSYPHSSGELDRNFISLYRGVDYLKGGHWKWLNSEDGNNNIIKVSLRLVKLFGLDNPLAQNTRAFNHEFVGHGIAIPEMNMTIDSLNVPFTYYGNPLFRITKNLQSDRLPFGTSAYLAFGFKSNIDYTFDQLAYTYASGIASSDVLRYTMQNEWIQNDRLTYNDALLYISAHWDYTTYLLNTTTGFSADASNYLTVVNIRNIPNFPDSLFRNPDALTEYGEENFQFEAQEMKTMAIVNAIGDPYLYSSLLSAFSYVFNGKTSKNLPYINIKGMKFMPSFGAHLSPFGLAYTLRSPLIINDVKMHVAFNYGSTYDNTYLGLGFKLFDLKRINNWSVSPHFEIFSQPKFRYGIENTNMIDNDDIEEIGGFGGLIALNFERIFNQSNLPLFINGRVGYKTAGYVPGEKFKSTPLVSIGVGTLLK